MSKLPEKFYDVVIVGGGVVGLTAALALAQQTQLTIAILESSPSYSEWTRKKYDHRVSAISPASKKIFESVDVWESIVNKRISPYAKMHVWDAEDKTEIHFDAADVNESALGFIIEDSVMRMSLLEKIRQYAQVDIFFSCKLKEITRNFFKQADRSWGCEKENVTEFYNEGDQFNNLALVIEYNQQPINTKLLIAADGANSLVRDLMNIQLKTWDYEHTAIVATVQTECGHQQTAWQRFLPTGPLAFLPLEEENQCSIVWSTSPLQAEQLLSLTDELFCQQLAHAFACKLGNIKATSTRYHFPLRMRHARNYVLSNLALIGDAAHTVHPLAGQGVNLGLLDASYLVDVIVEAVKKNRDFSSVNTLRRYERGRKSDNLAMLTGVEALKWMFSTENSLVQRLRNSGVHFVNQSQWIKNFFARYALGYRG